MAIPQPKWAVYYGTIRLIDGTIATYTAAEVAAFYGVQDEDYLEVPLVGVSPFTGGQDEVSYYHLKPKNDSRLYFNAIERYNPSDEEYLDEDFDSRRGGKWAVRPIGDTSQDYE
jgi:hypothetical protein